MKHEIENQSPVLKPADALNQIMIQGVETKRANTLGDDRGTLTELIDTNDSYWSLGLPWFYLVTCRPGKAKGWGLHKFHTDRYLLISGEMLLVLFDERDNSSTKGVVQEFYMSNQGVHQITIPPGVWHAHKNLGTSDLLFLNAPSQAFNHKSPDKRRLPITNDHIPYKFKPSEGW